MKSNKMKFTIVVAIYGSFAVIPPVMTFLVMYGQASQYIATLIFLYVICIANFLFWTVAGMRELTK